MAKTPQLTKPRNSLSKEKKYIIFLQYFSCSLGIEQLHGGSYMRGHWAIIVRLHEVVLRSSQTANFGGLHSSFTTFPFFVDL